MRCQTCGLDGPDGRDFCLHCGVAMIDKKHTPHLGQYRLDAKLGEGGMGVVYQATDEKLNREVAVKVLHPHLLQNDNLKERFRREARMHAKLMHPNVVTLLSLYEDNEHMALVMEMVHGKNLKEHLKANPELSLLNLVKICDAILAGLEAAHQLGLVHRDLKPANVLLSSDGSVKLMDFGLAKPDKQGDEDITNSGATVGSFRYMAPEQILNQPIDARTDLYAFGVMLYQMCTGVLPFNSSASGGEFEIMEKQVRETPKAPNELVPSIPLPLSDLIIRLLAKRPTDRPVNCKEVRKHLRAMLKQEISAQRSDSVVRAPMSQTGQDSNTDIAKGLLKALAQKISAPFRSRPVSEKQKKVTKQKKMEKAVISSPARKPGRGILTWLVLIGLIVGIGWFLISVMDLAKRPDSVQMASEMKVESAPEKETTAPAPEQAKPEEAKSEVSKPMVVAPVKKVNEVKKKTVATVKARAKLKPKPKPKPKPRPKKVARSVTFDIDHKVFRSDRSVVMSKKPHEFRGGSRVWFESLKEYAWKDKYRFFKKGEVRVEFPKGIKLSRIDLKKASVGRLSFKGGGYVRLSVQSTRGVWTQLFEREDDDVDIPVVIKGPKEALKDVKAVRLRFRTPEPITIGPIDLIR